MENTEKYTETLNHYYQETNRYYEQMLYADTKEEILKAAEKLLDLVPAPKNAEIEVTDA